ncbi:hypothetical protein B566_EDAN015835 [Ephemera danica]|nr:hypothetical protein B566_EDAN015835 [Ephemera danica]
MNYEYQSVIMERWQGRVAIVTGASAGIGAAIARLLAENGMKVVGVARRVERVQALAAEVKQGEIHALHGDVTKEQDVLRVVKWTRDTLGGADVLVNNAGVSPLCPLTSADSAKMRSILDTNVLGLCLFTREVIKDMRERGVDDGHVFHISSLAGQRIMDYPGLYFYSGTKHAVRVMTEGLRREMRDMGTKIRVTEISPGFVHSEIIEASGVPEDIAAQMYASAPCLEPRDIADALLYALSAPPHVQVHEVTIQPVGEKY